MNPLSAAYTTINDELKCHLSSGKCNRPTPSSVSSYLADYDRYSRKRIGPPNPLNVAILGGVRQA